MIHCFQSAETESSQRLQQKHRLSGGQTGCGRRGTPSAALLVYLQKAPVGQHELSEPSSRRRGAWCKIYKCRVTSV